MPWRLGETQTCTIQGLRSQSARQGRSVRIYGTKARQVHHCVRKRGILRRTVLEKRGSISILFPGLLSSMSQACCLRCQLQQSQSRKQDSDHHNCKIRLDLTLRSRLIPHRLFYRLCIPLWYELSYESKPQPSHLHGHVGAHLSTARISRPNAPPMTTPRPLLTLALSEHCLAHTPTKQSSHSRIFGATVYPPSNLLAAIPGTNGNRNRRR